MSSICTLTSVPARRGARTRRTGIGSRHRQWPMSRVRPKRAGRAEAGAQPVAVGERLRRACPARARSPSVHPGARRRRRAPGRSRRRSRSQARSGGSRGGRDAGPEARRPRRRGRRATRTARLQEVDPRVGLVVQQGRGVLAPRVEHVAGAGLDDDARGRAVEPARRARGLRGAGRRPNGSRCLWSSVSATPVVAEVGDHGRARRRGGGWRSRWCRSRTAGSCRGHLPGQRAGRAGRAAATARGERGPPPGGQRALQRRQADDPGADRGPDVARRSVSAERPAACAPPYRRRTSRRAPRRQASRCGRGGAAAGRRRPPRRRCRPASRRAAAGVAAVTSRRDSAVTV